MCPTKDSHYEEDHNFVCTYNVYDEDDVLVRGSIDQASVACDMVDKEGATLQADTFLDEATIFKCVSDATMHQLQPNVGFLVDTLES